jgi:hypothetical protein
MVFEIGYEASFGGAQECGTFSAKGKSVALSQYVTHSNPMLQFLTSDSAGPSISIFATWSSWLWDLGLCAGFHDPLSRTAVPVDKLCSYCVNQCTRRYGQKNKPLGLRRRQNCLDW